MAFPPTPDDPVKLAGQCVDQLMVKLKFPGIEQRPDEIGVGLMRQIGCSRRSILTGGSVPGPANFQRLRVDRDTGDFNCVNIRPGIL